MRISRDVVSVGDSRPLNPAVDELVKSRGKLIEELYSAGPWIDSLYARSMSVCPRGLPKELRNPVYPDYRDAVEVFRASLAPYRCKVARRKASLWGRVRVHYSRLEESRIRPLQSFADVYCVDPRLALSGLRTYLEPTPRCGAWDELPCEDNLAPTFIAISQSRLPSIPKNLIGLALTCIAIIEHTGLEPETREALQRAKQPLQAAPSHP